MESRQKTLCQAWEITYCIQINKPNRYKYTRTIIATATATEKQQQGDEGGIEEEEGEEEEEEEEEERTSDNPVRHLQMDKEFSKLVQPVSCNTLSPYTKWFLYRNLYMIR